MLFRKDIDPCCAYCTRAAFAGEGTVVCAKKGIMPENGRCKKFKYDPLKRIPPKPKSVDLSKFDERDYSL